MGGGAVIRRAIIFVIILVISFIGIGFLIDGNGKGKGTVVTATSTIEVEDNFLIHMRVEDVDDGIQVQCSLQYIGREDILLEHQTPLVSAFFDETIHDFTEDKVAKTLQQGSIYHQPTILLPYPEISDLDLKIFAKFWVNGELITIQHTEQLEFD